MYVCVWVGGGCDLFVVEQQIKYMLATFLRSKIILVWKSSF